MTIENIVYVGGKPVFDPGIVNKARRAASRLGWRMEKSRRRTIRVDHLGAFMLINENGFILCGHAYDATPAEILLSCDLEAERRAVLDAFGVAEVAEVIEFAKSRLTMPEQWEGLHRLVREQYHALPERGSPG